MADVIPFPLARRRPLIRKQAAWFTDQPAGAAEKNLARQLQVQRETLERRGVHPDVIAREISALEAAIRCEVWRQVLTPGGAA